MWRFKGEGSGGFMVFIDLKGGGEGDGKGWVGCVRVVLFCARGRLDGKEGVC